RRIGADGAARGTAPCATHPSRLDLAAAQQAQLTEQTQQPALA
ncbi:zinc finger domain-containing protein, partial [Streptomyces sp. DT225]